MPPRPAARETYHACACVGSAVGCCPPAVNTSLTLATWSRGMCSRMNWTITFMSTIASTALTPTHGADAYALTPVKSNTCAW
jgi:hypothetical protein